MTDRIKAADLRAALAKPKGVKRIIGAVRTVVDGITFDSAREARRWQQLCLMQRAGEISDLERQVSIALEGELGPIMTDSGQQQRVYLADFRYFDRRSKAWVIEDAKGHPTEVFKLKRAILAAMGLEIREV